MAQDDDPQVYESSEPASPESDLQAPAEPDAPRRSPLWPWIALAVVVLIVIFLLWLFWRQPQQSSKESSGQTGQESVVLTEVRPEPVIPQPSGGDSSTPVAELVPNVLGSLKNNAVRTLESAGYVVSTSVVRTSSKASGIVVGQRPGGGAALDPGSTVEIVVSASKQGAGDVKMPAVIGLSQSEAVAKVEAAGLTYSLTYGNIGGTADGHVLSQWPLAGESVPVGSEALIQIKLTP
jgi:beta-lactam-binding protein with PASTA domain